jgi:hypothetical protein
MLKSDESLRPEIIQQLTLAQASLLQAVRLLTRATPMAGSLSITKFLDKRAREIDKFKSEIAGLPL